VRHRGGVGPALALCRRPDAARRAQDCPPVYTFALRSLYCTGAELCGNLKVLPESRRSFVAELAAQYGHRLRRFLFTRARNSADVADLAQEVFLRLLRVEQHEIIRSPEAYLFTVASHVAHQHTLRKLNAPDAVDITQLFPELQMSASDDPLERAQVAERVKSLKRAVDQLPPKLATTLLLHRFDGYSLEEIAAKLGIARITAAKYLAQALLHCRTAARPPE
jgi:RNA polymerase sigma factor (sigma-70 family)